MANFEVGDTVTTYGPFAEPELGEGTIVETRRHAMFIE